MPIKRWIVAFLMLTALCAAPQAAKADIFTGEKTLGLKAGYNTWNERAVAGVQFSYRFNRLLRLSPDIMYVFRNSGVDALMIDLNMQFVFPVAGGSVNLFPLAGVNYSSWNFHPTSEQKALTGDYNDVSTRVNRLGLNVGAGLDVNITGSLKLSVGGVYTIIERFHGANITAGIHYRF